MQYLANLSQNSSLEDDIDVEDGVEQQGKFVSYSAYFETKHNWTLMQTLHFLLFVSIAIEPYP